MALQRRAASAAATFTVRQPKHRRLESTMQTAKQHCDQALQLPSEERMALVDQILDTLDEFEARWDAD